MILAFLPLAAFLALWWTWHASRPPGTDWRVSWLYASLLWGSYLAVSTELLSLVRGITPVGLALAWGIPLAGLLAWAARKRLNLPKFSFTRAWDTRLLAVWIASICFITAAAAWLSPPQTWDSLHYHMARAAHWAQEKAVVHFATGIEVQNVISPGGEIALLHLYVLGGGDQFVNFVQWFAMLSSLILTSLAAAQLGAGRIGQWLSALVTAAIPMGIIMASSSVNDYVTAYWCLAAAASVLQMQRSPTWRAGLPAAAAASLALWTKPIAAAYLLPLAVWAGWSALRRLGWRQALILGTLAAGSLALINGGHWLRNLATYGNPFSDQARLSTHANELVTPAGVVSNLSRNLAFHAALPWGRANLLTHQAVLSLHNWLGLSPEDPRTTAIGPFPVPAIRKNEEMAGNSLHAALILLCLAGMLIRREKTDQPLLVYGLAVSSTLIVFSSVFKWQIYGSRYHMPFFVLMAPFVGAALERLLPVRWLWAAGAALALGALPWLFSIPSRPLLPDDQSVTASILTASRRELLYANTQYLTPKLDAIMPLVRQSGCSQVSVFLGGLYPEYLIWWEMDAPRSDLRIEWVVAGTESARYRDRTFQPCALVCEMCAEVFGERYGSLELVYQDELMRLYLQP